MTKIFVDGDQLVLANDDFIDLQSSPAIFIPLHGMVIDEIGAAWANAKELTAHTGFVENMDKNDGSIWVIDIRLQRSEYVVHCPTCKPEWAEGEKIKIGARYLCMLCGNYWVKK